jgi:myo-inositol-1(or 4)-monophosphatase
MELVTKATIFAVNAHDGMKRKTNKNPYILHPMEAASIAGTMSESQELIAAALLHDVIEDADITAEEVEKEFGERVAELVLSETENKRADLPADTTWELRKQEAIALLKSTTDIDVKKLYLSDKLSNMRSFYREWKLLGDEMWQKFNQKDKGKQEWYYRSIADATSELSNFDAWQEYTFLVEKVFGRV